MAAPTPRSRPSIRNGSGQRLLAPVGHDLRFGDPPDPCGSRMANSSPPRRVTVAAGGMVAEQAFAT